LPAGQHLLVDIRNVEAAFLNSESRLAEAMVQTVRESEYVTKGSQSDWPLSRLSLLLTTRFHLLPSK
jgi:hypothetical protein